MPLPNRVQQRDVAKPDSGGQVSTAEGTAAERQQDAQSRARAAATPRTSGDQGERLDGGKTTSAGVTAQIVDHSKMNLAALEQAFIGYANQIGTVYKKQEATEAQSAKLYIPLIETMSWIAKQNKIVKNRDARITDAKLNDHLVAAGVIRTRGGRANRTDTGMSRYKLVMRAMFPADHASDVEEAAWKDGIEYDGKKFTNPRDMLRAGIPFYRTYEAWNAPLNEIRATKRLEQAPQDVETAVVNSLENLSVRVRVPVDDDHKNGYATVKFVDDANAAFDLIVNLIRRHKASLDEEAREQLKAVIDEPAPEPEPEVSDEDAEVDADEAEEPIEA